MVDCGCCVVLITVTHWGLGLVVGYLVVLFGCTAIVWGFVNKCWHLVLRCVAVDGLWECL